MHVVAGGLREFGCELLGDVGGLLAPDGLQRLCGRAHHGVLADEHEPAFSERLDEAEERREAGREDLLGAGGGRDRCVDVAQEPTAGVADAGGDEAVLGSEVFVEDRLGDARPQSDLVHRRGSEAAFGEDRLGHTKQLLLALSPREAAARLGADHPVDSIGPGYLQ
jgi:hypothetical protein